MGKRRGIHVTDHALLRFAERRHGIDLPAMREALAARIDSALEAARKGPVPDCPSAVILDGMRFTIEDGVVTTSLHRTREDRRTRGGAGARRGEIEG